MGYQIQYAPDVNYRYTTKKKRHLLTGKVFLVFVIVLLVIFSCTVPPIRNWILPGDPNVTNAATEKMVETLQNGEGIREAITAFCIEVLSHENQG